MNLAEALDILPDVTTTVRRKRTYKLDPRFVGREHLEEGTTVVLAHVPGSTTIFRFSVQQWQLIHLFESNSQVVHGARIIWPRRKSRAKFIARFGKSPQTR